MKLMLKFYGLLWSDRNITPAQALWKAKMDLKNGGAPLRELAGWVITGMSR